jgi:hypothetical protein
MLLEAIMLTPYIAIAASLTIAGTVTAVWLQSGQPPEAFGFHSHDRRRVPRYRGAVNVKRGSQVQEAA